MSRLKAAMVSFDYLPTIFKSTFSTWVSSKQLRLLAANVENRSQIWNSTVSFADLDQRREILSIFSLPKSTKHSVQLYHSFANTKATKRRRFRSTTRVTRLQLSSTFVGRRWPKSWEPLLVFNVCHYDLIPSLLGVFCGTTMNIDES
jgi:hypothetical protein